MRLSACHIALLLVSLVLSGPARAQSLTIQGRVANSANAPINGSAVQFRVQIRSPGASNCVLFDETHVLDLSTTNGLFSVNLNDGSGTVNAPSTYSLEAAISNRTAFSVNSSYCSSGSGVVTYTPNADDNRKVVIQFYDPSSMSGFEQIPELDLNPMAFAMESRTVGGYPASSVLRVDTGGIPGTAPAYTAGEAAELQLLARGTSTKYTPASATNGAQIPTYSSDPSSPPAGSIWYNSTSGELHYRTSGGTQVVGAGGGGGGTITAITVSGGLTGGGSSGSVSVAMPTGTAAQVLRYNGGAWAGYNFGLPDLLSSTLGSAVGSAVCTAGQTMYYDTTAKELKCQSIGLTNADLAGVLPVGHGGTGLSAGTVGAIPYFSSTSALTALAAGTNGQVLTMNGSGVPAWQSLPASSFTGSGTTNQLAKFTGANAVGNSILSDDGTNVGIGTTAPIAKLEVAGSLRLADGGESCSAGANVGMMKYSGGSLFFCNASGWQTLGVSGAGLTSLNGLTANTQTFAIGSAGTTPAWSSAGSVHTLNLPTASASNSGVLSSTDWSTFNGKLAATATFAGDVTGTYNANVVTKLQGIAVGTTAPAAGQSLKLVGSTWTPANLGFGDLKTAGGAATLASAACNAGQTMYYDSATGDLKCQSIAIDNASVTGVLPVANGGTGAGTTSQSYVFAGPAAGSGAPTFRALTTADISGLNTYWTSATGGINYAGGNVGVGTSAPAGALQVVTGSASVPALVANQGGAVLPSLSSGTMAVFAGNTSNTSYATKVDILGGSAGSAALNFGTSASEQAGSLVYNHSSNSLAVTVNSSERLRIDSAGNVGIGTNSPLARLDIGAGNLNFSGTGQRFTGDFSSPTLANRLAFQTNVTNGNTVIYAVPNGTSQTAAWTVANSPDPTNSSRATMAVIGNTDARFASEFAGTGSALPMTFYTNNGERMRVDTNGNVGVGTVAPIAKLEVAGSLRLADGGETCSAGANVGMMKYSGGSLFFCNASGWQTLGVSGAGLTSLNGLTGNTQTFAVGSAGTTPAWSSSGSVHTLNLPTASASNSGILSSADWSTFNGKLGATATFAGDVTGTYNANVVTKLQGVAVGTTAPSAGQFLKYGTSWAAANLGFGDLKTTGGAATMASAACNAGQTMYYDSSTGDLKCQSIGLANASITGILPIANGGTGASSTSQNYVFAGPTSGSGAPSFRALTSADISGLNTYWTSATGGINYASGNVGIGTMSPGSLLEAKGGAGDNAVLALKNNSNNSWLFWNDNGGSSLNVQYNGVNKMLVQSNGNVGIGTTTPKQRLQVPSTSRSNGIAVTNADVDFTMGLDPGTNRGVLQSWASGNATTVGTTPYDITINPMGGNIGIGTTSPDTKLTIQDAGAGQISFKNTAGSSIGYIGTSSIDGAAVTDQLRIRGDSGILFSIGGFPRMVMPAAGNVGIGTTAPSSLLQVNGTAQVNPDSGVVADTAGYASLGVTRASTLTGRPSYFALTRAGNVVWGQSIDPTNTWHLGTQAASTNTITNPYLSVSSSGNVGIGSTSPAYGLDARPASVNMGPVAQVYPTVNTSVPVNTAVKIPFSAADFDPDNTLDASNNRVRPLKAGYYRVNVSANTNNGNQTSAFTLTMALNKNGNTIKYYSQLIAYTGTFQQTMSLNSIVYMNGTTDYLEASMTSNNGTALVYGGSNSTWMSLDFLRSQ